MNAFQQFKNTLNDFMTDLPANSRYIQNKILEKVAPRVQLPTVQQMTEEQSNFNPLELNFETGPNKSMSAEMNKYVVAPFDPNVNALKQAVLMNNRLRPAMQRYLSTVPVYFTPNPQSTESFPDISAATDIPPIEVYDNPPVGSVWSNDQPWEKSVGTYQPIIDITQPRNPLENKIANKVLLHEYIHAAPRNLSLKQQFINFFNQINPQTQPLLWKIGLTYLGNGLPPPNSEEFYATVGEKLGSRVLNNSEMQPYYKNIFLRTKNNGK